MVQQGDKIMVQPIGEVVTIKGNVDLNKVQNFFMYIL